MVVMARMLADPAYAARVREPGRFAEETLSTHREITSLRHGARAQLPWPRALGTPPWAVSRALQGATGRTYGVAVVRDRDSAYDAIAARTGEHHPVAVFVGSRHLPRHVVLAIRPADDDGGRALWTYEPAAGRVLRVRRERWVRGPLDLAGWSRPWLVVSPATATR